MNSFEDRDGWIWKDGEFYPWKDARIHVLTHGLHYASSVFEGERAYNGKIFKSRQHSERLIKSAEILGMSFPYTVDEIEEAKYATLEKNSLTDAYIRPVAWRGGEQMGISAKKALTHVAIACWEWPSYFPAEVREKGISLKTSPWQKPAANTAPTQSKAAGLYMIGTLSKHWAEDQGYTDALMLDYRGNVVEATGANFFMVVDGVLITPPPDCFLNGITRQTLIQLAKEHGIPLEEKIILPEDLKKADEIFLTGTAAEVTAVGKIDDLEFTVGPITRKLRDAYETLVRS
jgi:branched-chain amino acid aminotransferase